MSKLHIMYEDGGVGYGQTSCIGNTRGAGEIQILAQQAHGNALCFIQKHDRK